MCQSAADGRSTLPAMPSRMLQMLLTVSVALLALTPAVTLAQYPLPRDSHQESCHQVLTRCVSGQPCPDLVVDGARVQSTAQVVQVDFTSTSCAYVEGCTQPGSRTLLRFDMATQNIGTANAYIGDTTNPYLAPCFVWSSCHAHYHFEGFAQYLLLSGSTVVARGHKSSSCLEDSLRNSNTNAPWVDPANWYDCRYQVSTERAIQARLGR